MGRSQERDLSTAAASSGSWKTPDDGAPSSSRKKDRGENRFPSSAWREEAPPRVGGGSFDAPPGAGAMPPEQRTGGPMGGTPGPRSPPLKGASDENQLAKQNRPETGRKPPPPPPPSGVASTPSSGGKRKHPPSSDKSKPPPQSTRTPKSGASGLGRGSSLSGGYGAHWDKLAPLTASECESSEIAIAYGCEAVRQRKGPRGWASTLGGGIIGMYDTREEAIKRAVCAAMFHNEFEPGLKTPQPSLKRAKSSRATTASKSPPPDEVKKSTVPATNHGTHEVEGSEGVSTKKSPPFQPSTGSARPQNAQTTESTPPLQQTSDANAKEHVNQSVSPEKEIRSPKPEKKKRVKHGRPKACEMSHPVTKEVLETFRSCSQAERVTGINRSLIGQACRAGGGVVENKFFRFVYLDAKKAERDEIEFDGIIAHDDKSPKTSAADASDDEDEPAGQTQSGAMNMQHDHLSHGTGATTKESLSPQACRSKHSNGFNACALRPLRAKHKPPSAAKRVVELVDKVSGEVLVCFRGNADAGQALSLCRKKVASFCAGDEEFGSFPFTLRHAARGAPLSAYEYGAHPEDFHKTDETREERLSRWKKTFETEKAQEGECNRENSGIENRDSLGNDTEMQRPAGSASGKDDKEQKVNRIGLSEDVPIASLGGTTSMKGDTMVRLRKPSSWKYDNMCVICQEKRAQIVFEPCHHCVLCESCSANACRKFCPTCRAPIQARTQPTLARLIRPRIYSAYSYM